MAAQRYATERKTGYETEQDLCIAAHGMGYENCRSHGYLIAITEVHDWIRSLGTHRTHVVGPSLLVTDGLATKFWTIVVQMTL